MVLGDIESDIGLEIGRHNATGFSHIFKFGENKHLTTSEQTIWDGGGLYEYPPVEGTILKVSSDDTNDTSTGTGVRKIKLYGNDENLNIQNEEIIMNGTTPVLTTKTFSRIWRMKVLDAGANGFSAGNIYAGAGVVSGGVPNKIYAQIIGDNNQTLMSLFTIPKGYHGLLNNLVLNVGKGRDSRVRIYINDKTRPPFTAGTGWLYSNSIVREFNPPLFLSEYSDIEIRAYSTGAGTEISCDFSIILYEKIKNGVGYAKFGENMQ